VVPEGAVGRRVILPHPLESGASICHSARLAAHLSVRGSERRRIVVARGRFMRRDNNTQAARKLAVGVHGRVIRAVLAERFHRYCNSRIKRLVVATRIQVCIGKFQL